MLDQIIRLPLCAAAVAAVLFTPVAAQADVSPDLVQRDANGFAFVQVAGGPMADRRFIPLSEYVQLQASGQAPQLITMNARPSRRIAPDAIGAQWNVGVFR